jgi:hypothetical protein
MDNIDNDDNIDSLVNFEFNEDQTKPTGFLEEIYFIFRGCMVIYYFKHAIFVGSVNHGLI